jgi:hypothetical protein
VHFWTVIPRRNSSLTAAARLGSRSANQKSSMAFSSSFDSSTWMRTVSRRCLMCTQCRIRVQRSERVRPPQLAAPPDRVLRPWRVEIGHWPTEAAYLEHIPKQPDEEDHEADGSDAKTNPRAERISIDLRVFDHWPYFGARNPGERTQSLMYEPTSAWRALRRASSRTGPWGAIRLLRGAAELVRQGGLQGIGSASLDGDAGS